MNIADFSVHSLALHKALMPPCDEIGEALSAVRPGDVMLGMEVSYEFAEFLRRLGKHLGA